MKHFAFVITNPSGFDLQPAGELNRMARKYKSAIVVHRGEKAANVLRLMALMQLGIKRGDQISVNIEGEDEAAVAPIIEKFFKANF